MIAILLLCAMITSLYFLGTRNFKYWQKKGIKYCKPMPFFGNSLRKYCQLISPTDQLVGIYKNFPEERYVGCFEANHLALVIRDPELVKHILVADFYHFFPKGMNMHQTEPLMNNLFSADGDLWRILRQKLTIAFTTGKLKAMFPLILERCKRLEGVLKNSAKEGKEIDIRDLTGKYAIDVIAACGFGIDNDSLNEKPSLFRQLGQRIFKVNIRDAFVMMCKFVAPDLFKNLHFFAPEVENMMISIVKKVVEIKRNAPSKRMDFMDILLDMQQKELVGESLTKHDNEGNPQKTELVLNDELLTAQAFILFGAGYETSSTAISYTLHQLAFHPDEQKKCQEEIGEVLAKHGGLTVAAIKELKYLEMAFKEALRMYPPIGYLIRKCAKKYTFPGTDLTIDPRVTVLVPVQAIQNDEKYFEEPSQFKPNRFHPDNIENIKSYSYFPFGAGPRTCIGGRLGHMTALTCLASILQSYNVIPSKNSRKDLITASTTALVQNIKGGIPLTFVARPK